MKADRKLRSNIRNLLSGTEPKIGQYRSQELLVVADGGDVLPSDAA